MSELTTVDAFMAAGQSEGEPEPREPERPDHEQMVVTSAEPLRLAELCLRAEWSTPNGHVTLRRWRNDFQEWNQAQGHYRELVDDEIDAKLYNLLDRVQVRVVDSDGIPHKRPLRPDARLVAEVRKALPSRGILVDGDAPQWLEWEPGLPATNDVLPCRNGLLNVATGELLKPTPMFFNVCASPVDYDPSAAAPRTWLKFLREILPGDEEAIRSLAEFTGLCLTPDTSQQKMLLLVGPPRCGKGNFMRVLSRLVGNDNVCAPALNDLGKAFGLMPLLNRTVATITDARLSNRSDLAAIVERMLSISGEDMQTVDRKFKPPVSAQLQIRFIVATNELPRLEDASGALVSRFLTIVFAQSFLGKEDTTLTKRFYQELPGILNWALEGLARLRERGRLVTPQSAKEAVCELEELSSPVMAFVRERCVVEMGAEVRVDLMFGEWVSYAEAQGMRAGRANALSRNLRAAAAGVSSKQKRDDNRASYRVFTGIRLKEGRE